jgi:hypothetical protein
VLLPNVLEEEGFGGPSSSTAYCWACKGIGGHWSGLGLCGHILPRVVAFCEFGVCLLCPLLGLEAVLGHSWGGGASGAHGGCGDSRFRRGSKGGLKISRVCQRLRGCCLANGLSVPLMLPGLSEWSKGESWEPGPLGC